MAKEKIRAGKRKKEVIREKLAKKPKGTQPVKTSGPVKYGSKECVRNRSQYSDGRMYSKAEEWFAMHLRMSKLSSFWLDLFGPFLK